MAFWSRINQPCAKVLSQQLARGYFQSPSASLYHSAKLNRLARAQNSGPDICQRPNNLCDNVRFFAGLAQARLKKDEPDGIRLNAQITAPYVRLVTDEGHYVVSRQEALERARKLEVDLVEVQRRADPPVCKLMDYNKERYKKDVEEKERAKGKGEQTLRKGEGKEVRFTRKIEDKDLKMKADTAIRLMERGYRVKCMAVKENGKEHEEVDLGALLSRFTPLIEEVAAVESGPRVEKKQAYVVVRHIKFGASKKGAMKKLKDINVANPQSQEATSMKSNDSSSSDAKTPKRFPDQVDFETEAEDEIAPESVSSSTKTWARETKDDKTGRSASVSGKNIIPDFSLGKSPIGPTSNFSNQGDPSSISSRAENRYLRKESVSTPSLRQMANRDPSMREPSRYEPHASNQYVNQTARQQYSNRSPDLPNSNLDQQYPKRAPYQQSPRRGFPNNQTSGFGIFSNPKTNSHE